MESSFFVTVEALKQMQPNLRADAVDLLRAFDSNRDRIYAIERQGGESVHADVDCKAGRRASLL